jgi:hypothetical protein
VTNEHHRAWLLVHIDFDDGILVNCDFDVFNTLSFSLFLLLLNNVAFSVRLLLARRRWSYSNRLLPSKLLWLTEDGVFCLLDQIRVLLFRILFALAVRGLLLSELFFVCDGIIVQPIKQHDRVFWVGVGHVVEKEEYFLLFRRLWIASLISFEPKEFGWLAFVRECVHLGLFFGLLSLGFFVLELLLRLLFGVYGLSLVKEAFLFFLIWTELIHSRTSRLKQWSEWVVCFLGGSNYSKVHLFWRRRVDPISIFIRVRRRLAWPHRLITPLRICILLTKAREVIRTTVVGLLVPLIVLHGLSSVNDKKWLLVRD